MTTLTPETRFSDRVENYVRYRPRYPVAMTSFLEAHLGLHAGTVVADVGSGTGISAQPFLDLGCTVFGVEPNPEMRAAAERVLADEAKFHSVAGTAQATGLATQSVEVVLAAQAFHWFNSLETRAEFARILKPMGNVVLVWNERQHDATAFLREYEELLLRFATDYTTVRHENIDQASLAGFFQGAFTEHRFPNAQNFDLPGLRGRLLSSSYAPAPGHPQYDLMMTELHRIFAKHEESGEVRFEYETAVYVGKIPP